ncbi:MAG TPA: glycosyltransferase family 2 protein [Trebonia sp.]|nr:glycosyltransferase family 2 protein [Trebonia sp.]
MIISKDEPSLDETLTDVASQLSSLAEPGEIVVVDASGGRLDDIRLRHAQTVRWVDFQPPPGVRVSIPHQRNVGVREARGDVIVFTDAGCRPLPGWLERLVAPLRADESVTAGVSQDMAGQIKYELPPEHSGEATYLRESPTLNFAFRRAAFDAVGGFDESFQYGSDVDFSWRLNDMGYRIRCVPDAIIRHDYGSPRRQRRRSYVYGKARARLYRKHRARRRQVLRDDPMVVVYPLFLLGLPLTLVFPLYPLLLLIPAWRNRSRGVIQVLVDHLWFGAGVLAELAGR